MRIIQVERGYITNVFRDEFLPTPHAEVTYHEVPEEAVIEPGYRYEGGLILEDTLPIDFFGVVQEPVTDPYQEMQSQILLNTEMLLIYKELGI